MLLTLRTIGDIISIIKEESFIKDCRAYETKCNFVMIHVQLSLINFLFRRKEILEKVNTIIMPRMPFTTSYKIIIKLFL